MTCGYSLADYFGYWLSFAQRTGRAKLPKIFFVNWFRRGADGKFLWPGYGENARVLKWVCERIEGTAPAQATPIGYLPTPEALDLTGLTLPAENLSQLLAVDLPGWKNELASIAESYAKFGDAIPPELRGQLAALRERITKA